MSKLANDIRIGWLGAFAGLFTSSLFLLVERVDAYYAYLSRLNEADYGVYERGVDNLRWLPVSFWNVLMFTAASLLVHRYLATRWRSKFLLWQVISAGALLGWFCSLTAGVGLECLMQGDLDALERVLTPLPNWYVIKFVATIFAANVAYGSMLESAARHDAEAIASLQQGEA